MSAVFFGLHALMLAFAWFAIISGTATLAVAVVVRLLVRQARRRPASLWLALRLFPTFAATVVVAGMFLPSYWLYEPREYTEGFQAALSAVALTAAAIVIAAIARGAAAWLRVSRRAAAWTSIARRVEVPGAAMTVFRFDTDAPIMALAGVFKPRLFISRSIMASLSGAELRVSIAHEVGHRRSCDNLKRLLQICAPDFLALSLMRDLERRWTAAAEHDADRRACDVPDAYAARCALAAAIVKVARLMPADSMISEPISALVDGSDIESRVRSLLDGGPPTRQPAANQGRAALLLALTAATIVSLSAGYTSLLWAMHEATEVLVRALP